VWRYRSAEDDTGDPPSHQWGGGCVAVQTIHWQYNSTVRSESRCALRLRYVDLAVSTEVAVAVCCCLTVFSC
jgi:hypothetical protein